MATILIAEDDHAISALVAYNLERAGHTPLAAYDGLTALEVARRDKPEASSRMSKKPMTALYSP